MKNKYFLGLNWLGNAADLSAGSYLLV